MAYSRHNPFSQLISYDAGWVSRQLGGSGPNAAGWYHCRCLVHHGGSLTALGLKNAPSGRLIAKCFYGCAEAEIHLAIDRLVEDGGVFLRSVPSGSQKSLYDGAPGVGSEQAARIWNHSHPDPLIKAYLRSRSITITPPEDLRLYPDLYHRSGQRSPAMVALVRNVDGEPVSVHRTWLAADGRSKAPVDPNKMSLGPVSGCAIRLALVTDTVLLGEGLETTLSAMQLTGLPGWSTISSPGLKAVELPPEIRTVTIAIDHDPPGLEAAQALCRRLEAEGRTVTMIRPNREGADFNDILREAAR